MDNLIDVEVVVILLVIKLGNVELDEVCCCGLFIVCCVEMLVELMWFKFNIVVVGMYGKIMIIMMVFVLLDYGNFDFIVVNGGIIYVYGLNVCVGDGEWMVVEVDEFDGMFN